ncbi:MAG: nucleoside deaminase [Bacteroidia bacterium]
MESFLLNDEYFMRAALTEAQKAFDSDEVPVGAVIVCKNRIIARAHNMTERLTDVTAHAEMLAFTAAGNYLGSKYLQDCTLYVTLEPCLMCAGAGYWTQLDRIVYGAIDEKRGYGMFGEGILHPRTQITKGVLADDCAELIRGFFRSKR